MRKYNEIEEKYIKSLSHKLIVELILGVISLVGAIIVTLLPSHEEQPKFSRFWVIFLSISFFLIITTIVVIVEIRYSRNKKIYDQEMKKREVEQDSSEEKK